jgi:hypothetical protein
VNESDLADQIERRARELAGDIHVHGAIPARFWKEAIREREQRTRLADHLYRWIAVLAVVWFLAGLAVGYVVWGLE